MKPTSETCLKTGILCVFVLFVARVVSGRSKASLKVLFRLNYASNGVWGGEGGPIAVSVSALKFSFTTCCVDVRCWI